MVWIDVVCYDDLPPLRLGRVFGGLWLEVMIHPEEMTKEIVTTKVVARQCSWSLLLSYSYEV